MLHGAGICPYIYPQKWPSFVGKYSSTMVRIWDGFLLPIDITPPTARHPKRDLECVNEVP